MPEEAKPVTAREPRPLSTEYHKARKQLMLWAGILFVWELVGVDLNKAVATGGNIGTIVNSIKSPQAVPWALLILVLYFLFKCSIEWAQCHVDRRRVRFARIDFVSAWLLAGAAIALYTGQAISHVQFADLLQNHDTRVSLGTGLVMGWGSAFLIQRLITGPEVRRRFIPFVIGVIFMFVAGPIEMKLFGYSMRLAPTLVGALTGAIVSCSRLLFRLAMRVLPKQGFSFLPKK